MTENAILYPILAHILLVFSLFSLLTLRRTKAAKEKAVDLKEIAVNNNAWPDYALLASNNIINQFEAPVIFYALCIITYITETTTTLGVILASVYMALRYAHAYVHVTSNHVPHRQMIFTISMFVLMAIFILTTVQITGLI